MPVNYASNVQTVTVPYTGTYKLEVWGAQGGQACHHGTCNSTYAGGAGGYAYGEVQLTEGTILYVVIGGKGKDATNTSYTGGAGGYNGGGNVGMIITVINQRLNAVGMVENLHLPMVVKVQVEAAILMVYQMPTLLQAKIQEMVKPKLHLLDKIIE